MRLRFHTQTAAATLTKAQPVNNVVRTAFQALSAVLGGAQSLHTNGLDEAYAIPSEFAMKIALRTQQIIADETLVTNTIDPLGGSWYVEALTDRIEADINGYLEKVEEMGGTLRAIELSFFQREIADFAYDIAKRKASGELPVIGVNRYVDEGEDHKVEVHKIDPETEQRKIGMLREVKAGARRGRRAGRARRAGGGRARPRREPDAGDRSTPSRRRRRWARSSTRSRASSGATSRRRCFEPHRALRRRLADAGLAGALVMHPVSVYYLAGTGQPANLLVVPGREPVLYARRYLELARRVLAASRDVRAGRGLLRRSSARRWRRAARAWSSTCSRPALVDRARKAPRSARSPTAPRRCWRCARSRTRTRSRRCASRWRCSTRCTRRCASTCGRGSPSSSWPAELARALRRAGHDGVVFQRRWDAKLPMEGALASGENLSTISRGPITVTGVGLGEAFPMGASRREIERGDLVNVDLGLNRAGYHGDMARTLRRRRAAGRDRAGSRGTAARSRTSRSPRSAPASPRVGLRRRARRPRERLGVEDVFQGGGPYIGHGDRARARRAARARPGRGDAAARRAWSSPSSPS